MKKFFPILLLSYVAYLVFTTSCANPGVPVGGAKDTISPVVIKTLPEFNGRNYNGTTVSLTFNEFVISSELRDQLVVSPPLKKQPTIRSKSKTLIIDLGENLKENTTYSLDFKDAIVDNNEKNPLEDFRFSFSTGPDFDSLMIGGYVKNAENLEPIEDALVVLQARQELAAFKDSIPDYIGKTDEEGFFVIGNIAAGTYKLYAILDADNSLNFNQELEQIAFYDSLVIPQEMNLPTSQAEAEMGDTVSLKIKRRNALEDPFFLMMFEENVFDQFLDSYKREQANLIRFYFSESLSDSFHVELLQPDDDRVDWGKLEFNTTRDSIMLWITDTLLCNTDTLKMNLSYLVADSLKNLVVKNDTLDFFYKKPEEPKKKRKKNEDEPVKIPHITLKHNLKSKGFDIYRDIVLEAPEPLKSFDLSMVHLFQKVDTLEEAVNFEVVQDSLSLRKYYIKYPWEFESEYRFQIDSAAAKNYFDQPSSALNQKFEIQEENYYAKIILSVSNLKGKGIIQLLENSDKENVLQQISIKEDNEIEFPYLKPDKYKIRLILDNNGNGLWDTGNIEEGIQPEQVMYYSKILKLRSNFEVREAWVLPDNLPYQKELIDEDKQKEDSKKQNKASR